MNLVSFIQGKASMDWGGQCFTGSGRSSRETWGKSKFYRALEGATWKQGRLGFPYKSLFWVDKLTKADLEDCSVLGFLDRCFP